MRTPYEACRVWIEKSKGEDDYYDRFVYLWFALNALYNNYFDSYNDNERNAIRKLIDANTNLFSQQVVDGIINDSSALFFTRRTIRDCKGSGRDTSEEQQKLSRNYGTAVSKIKALCMILYQVRCNLFHGNKIFGNESDDEIVKQASIALCNIIRVLCL